MQSIQVKEIPKIKYENGEVSQVNLNEIEIIVFSSILTGVNCFSDLWYRVSQQINILPRDLMEVLARLLNALRAHKNVGFIEIAGIELYRDEMIDLLSVFTLGSEKDLSNIVLDKFSRDQLVNEFKARFVGGDADTCLTDREVDMIEGLLLGLSNRELAERFALNIVTVKNYISTILHKMDVSSRTEVVATAMRWLLDSKVGLLPTEEV